MQCCFDDRLYLVKLVKSKFTHFIVYTAWYNEDLNDLASGWISYNGSSKHCTQTIYHYYHKFETNNQENAVIYQTSIKKSQAFLITDDIGRGGAIVHKDHQRPQETPVVELHDIGRGGAIVREDHQRPINKTKR